LLPAVIDAVPSVPVVAAGGIADGRTVAAALALGADAVWVGTRLLASFEAYAHPQYKDRVVAAGVEDTARHLIFGPEFPDASTRGLRNRIVREWERRDDPPPYKVVPDSETPLIGQAHLYGQEFPMKRFCGFPPTPEFTGDLEEMSLLAGESVGQTKRLMSAASIIDEMISGAEAVIRKRLGSMVVDYCLFWTTKGDHEQHRQPPHPVDGQTQQLAQPQPAAQTRVFEAVLSRLDPTSRAKLRRGAGRC
jgi:enoyl-[acyl-carrier protein] reductase II